MTLRKILFLLLSLSLLCLGNAHAQSKSRVREFNYDGLGDDVEATLEGTVFLAIKSIDQKDTLVASPFVKITCFDKTKKLYKTSSTDAQGRFAIKFRGGIYSLIIQKAGYQPILVQNYEAAGDQFAYIDILLEKGHKQQLFFIPPR